MFNIADGGFTELHTLWAEEKTKGFQSTVWGRHHDYWLLKAISTYGYCRWTEICSDTRFSLLNKAFVPQVEAVSDPKSRFLLKRFKLLEQALAVEEQLHRASNAGLVQDPNQSVMQLHSRFTDLDCLADGHLHLVKECLSGDTNALLLMRKALGKIEDLLVDMKMDLSRLPNELSKIPSVSKQLKLDELSTLTKMAQRGEVVPASVITQAPSTTSVISGGNAAEKSKSHVTSISQKPAKKEMVVVQDGKRKGESTGDKHTTKTAQYSYQSTNNTAALVPLAANSGLALQTPEGLLVAAPYTAIKTSQPSTSTNDRPSYAVNVPTYVDNNQVYQAAAVQLVPVSAGQQIMVWPPVVQGKTAPQLTVVQGSQLISMVETASTNAQGQKNNSSSTTGNNASIITID